MIATINRRCPWCGYISSVVCKKSDYDAYIAGALAQDAFVDMDLRQREILISGMCLECQESFFVEEDDEEENMCDGICDLCSLQDECVGSDIL